MSYNTVKEEYHTEGEGVSWNYKTWRLSEATIFWTFAHFMKTLPVVCSSDSNYLKFCSILVYFVMVSLILNGLFLCFYFRGETIRMKFCNQFWKSMVYCDFTSFVCHLVQSW